MSKFFFFFLRSGRIHLKLLVVLPMGREAKWNVVKGNLLLLHFIFLYGLNHCVTVLNHPKLSGVNQQSFYSAHRFYESEIWTGHGRIGLSLLQDVCGLSWETKTAGVPGPRWLEYWPLIGPLTGIPTNGLSVWLGLPHSMEAMFQKEVSQKEASGKRIF